MVLKRVEIFALKRSKKSGSYEYYALTSTNNYESSSKESFLHPNANQGGQTKNPPKKKPKKNNLKKSIF